MVARGKWDQALKRLAKTTKPLRGCPIRASALDLAAPQGLGYPPQWVFSARRFIPWSLAAPGADAPCKRLGRAPTAALAALGPDPCRIDAVTWYEIRISILAHGC
jgi:hypothetical protein